MIHNLIILVGCRDHRNLLRFPSDGGDYHGFITEFEEEQSKASFVKEQVCLKLSVEDPGSVVIHTYIENDLPPVSGRSYQLAIVEVDGGALQAPEEWLTLPLILRGMEKGKGRLAYNKAMQVYAGGLSQEVDALEVDDEVRERLRQLEKDGKI